MNKFERIAFLLLAFTLPFQIGKHFWPDFSFVDGIRVDYLSPTLYLSDVCFFLLLAFSLKRLWLKVLTFVKHPLTILLVLGVIISNFFSIEPLSALYGTIKLLEFIYLALFVANSLPALRNSATIFVLVLGGLIQVVILLFQLFSQSSIGGIFYFLGERTFNPSTPGIALYSWNESLFLRPYGTFPHPNVLAFYLLTVFTFYLFMISKINKRFAHFLVLFFLFCGILLTLSKVVIILSGVVLIVWFLNKAKWINKRNRAGIILSICFLIFSFLAVLISNMSSVLIRDSMLRLELLQIGFSVLIKNWLFGTGLQNFFYHEIEFQKTVSPILLQPIHNIFMQWIVQTGIVGGAITVLFIRNVLLRNQSLLGVIFIVCIISVGMFDHYLITLQQGQMMLAVLLGFIFANSKG